MNNIPRGIRNNNPGNIRYDGTRWLGLAAPPTDGSFCRFADAKHGIRALAAILKNYDKKHGLNTVAQIIGRWAPPNENDTRSYIAAVSAALGHNANDALNVSDKNILLCLCKAIIRHENGKCPYTDADILSGIDVCS
ncbi:MAG: hypothetical protein LBL21_04480 [Rickettsiales bacterium]|jgi:hypothetical protein|nr:hypothetical protein [Rickettsiales bacterium]